MELPVLGAAEPPRREAGAHRSSTPAPTRTTTYKWQTTTHHAGSDDVRSPATLFTAGPLTLDAAAPFLMDLSAPTPTPSRAPVLPTATTATATTATATGSRARRWPRPRVGLLHGAPPATHTGGTPTALLAAHVTDPHDWVLAVRHPPTTHTSAESGAAVSSPRRAGADNAGPASSLAEPTTTSTTAAAVVVPPLEERLTLADLRRAMWGFASAVAVTDAELMGRAEREAKARREASLAGSTAAGLGGGSHRPGTAERSGTSAAAPASTDTRSAVAAALPATADELAVMLLRTPRKAGEATTSKAAVVPAATNTATTETAVMNPTATAARATAFDRTLTTEEFVALMRRVVAANPIHTTTTTTTSTSTTTTTTATATAASHARQGSAPTEAGPTLGVGAVTDEEIRQLMMKVDYDGHGNITWNEFATFFISQSRHRSQMFQMSVQYTAKPDPVACTSVLERHQRSITCYVMETSKKILVTGSADGTVHAWGTRSLAHRGLIFSADEDWIVGVHFGTGGRLLFIATMGRRVYVLDGATFEVLSCYRGRAVDDSAASIVYAHDSTRAVPVGGVPPPPRPVSGAAPGTAAALQQKQQRYLRQRAAEAAGANPGRARTTAAVVMTTALAYETLDLDTAPLTTRGNGPCVSRRINEDVIVGLVDAVTATEHHYSALDEETLLLGTTNGDVYLLVVPPRPTKRVLVPKHVLRLHGGERVNRMRLLPALDALFSCGDDGRTVMASMVTGTILRVFHAPGFPHQHVAVHDFAVSAALRMVVTVGPERSALVWDMAQPLPVAVLDPHNSPCQCCSIAAADGVPSSGDLPPHILTAGVDGSIRVFDASMLQCVQTFDPAVSTPGGGAAEGGAGDAAAAAAAAAAGGSGEASGGAAAGPAGVRATTMADHQPVLMLGEPGRRSVLCFSRYPFRLHMKRQVTSTCPARYHGHAVPMLSVLYTSVFDMLVTVDTDARAMTWHMRSGKNVFAFSLADFSDSATVNATRLTAVALDGTQRRMLTGLRNGAVVVWNVVNGQPTNFITSGMAGDGLGAPPDAAREDVERPWRRGARGAAATARETPPDGSGGGAVTGGSGSGGGGGGKTGEVTAVASLVRHGAVFIVFAVGCNVLVVQEDVATFTVASVYGRWTLAPAYGEVGALLQVSPQLIACGTASGALLFFHALSGQQEGAALWVREATPATSTTNVSGGGAGGGAGAGSGGSWPLLSPSSPRDRHGGGADTRRRLSTTEAAPNVTVTTNTTRLRSLGMSVSQLQTASSPSAALSASVVSARVVRLLGLARVHPSLLLSIHADGTVALWHTLRRLYLGSVNLCAAGGLSGAGRGGAGDGDGAGLDDGAPTVVVDVNARNDTLVFADERGAVHVCELRFRPLPLASADEAWALALPNPAWCVPALQSEPRPRAEDSPHTREASFANSTPDAPGAQLEAERVVYVFDRLTRVRSFASGLPSSSSVLVVDPRPTPTEESGEPLIVVCSAESQHARVFALDGVPIGEPGMDPWVVGDRSTYRYLGDPIDPPTAEVEPGVRDGGREPASRPGDAGEETEGGLAMVAGERNEEEGAGAASPGAHTLVGGTHSRTDSTPAVSDDSDEHTSATTTAAARFDYLAESYTTYQQQMQQQQVVMHLGAGRRTMPGRSFTCRTRRSSVVTTSDPLQSTLTRPQPQPLSQLQSQQPQQHFSTPMSPRTPSRSSPESGAAAGSRLLGAELTRAAPPPPPQPVPVPVPGLTLPTLDRPSATVIPRHVGPAAPPLSTLMTRKVQDTPAHGRLLKRGYARRLSHERRARTEESVPSTTTTTTATTTPTAERFAPQSLNSPPAAAVDEAAHPDVDESPDHQFLLQVRRADGGVGGRPATGSYRDTAVVLRATTAPEAAPLPPTHLTRPGHPHTAREPHSAPTLTTSAPTGQSEAEVESMTVPTVTSRGASASSAHSAHSTSTLLAVAAATASPDHILCPIALVPATGATDAAPTEVREEGARAQPRAGVRCVGKEGPVFLAHCRSTRPGTSPRRGGAHRRPRAAATLAETAPVGETGGGPGDSASASEMDLTAQMGQYLEERRQGLLRNMSATRAGLTEVVAPVSGAQTAGGDRAPAAAAAVALAARAAGLGSGQAAGHALTAHSFIASLSARMYVAPVGELEPPMGSRSRAEAKAWRDHLKRLQDGKAESSKRGSLAFAGGRARAPNSSR